MRSAYVPEQIGVAREHRQQLALPARDFRSRSVKTIGIDGAAAALNYRQRARARHPRWYIDWRQILVDLHRRGPIGIKRNVVVRVLLDRCGHRRRRTRSPGTATGTARTSRTAARASSLRTARALDLRALTLVVLLTPALGILTLGDIAKHAARARAHGLQVQTQQVSNLDKVRVDVSLSRSG